MAKLMFIDDNEATLTLMERISSILGHQFIACSDECFALEQARESNPDLIFIDLGLQNIDGLTLLKSLRDDNTTAPTPMFIVSAGQSERDAENALAAGAAAYFQKPVRFEDITYAVKTYLTNKNTPNPV